MVNSTVITPIEGDVALQAKEKREFLFNFYDNMMKGGDILSVEDIDIVIFDTISIIGIATVIDHPLNPIL